MASNTDKLLALAHNRAVLRPRDLASQGIAREYLRLACAAGQLERIGRGLYRLPGAPPTEHQSLVEVCARVPAGVICLLSALRFHGLTTQNPFEVWLAIGERAHLPRMDTVSIRVARFSGKAFSAEIENHPIHGAPVRVYSVAKTVADCFKYRNKVGVDVAVEALRDCLRERRTSVDMLLHSARICRVERVMKPYMEALL
jgi:predicted transcriptional regulator of viral defense system